jgi:hypothetical protein
MPSARRCLFGKPHGPLAWPNNLQSDVLSVGTAEVTARLAPSIPKPKLRKATALAGARPKCPGAPRIVRTRRRVLAPIGSPY